MQSSLFHKKYKFVFDVQTRDRTYYLVAMSADDMKMWVDALCKLCGFMSQGEEQLELFLSSLSAY